MSHSFLSQGRSGLAFHFLHHFFNFFLYFCLLFLFWGQFIFLLIFLFLFDGFDQFIGVLFGVVLEVALKIIGVDILFFVDLVDIIGVEIDVLHAFEVKLGEEKLLVVIKVILRHNKDFSVDSMILNTYKIFLHA